MAIAPQGRGAWRINAYILWIFSVTPVDPRDSQDLRLPAQRAQPPPPPHTNQPLHNFSNSDDIQILGNFRGNLRNNRVSLAIIRFMQKNLICKRHSVCKKNLCKSLLLQKEILFAKRCFCWIFTMKRPVFRGACPPPLPTNPAIISGIPMISRKSRDSGIQENLWNLWNLWNLSKTRKLLDSRDALFYHATNSPASPPLQKHLPSSEARPEAGPAGR